MEVCRYGLSGSQLQTVTNSPSVWVSVRVCVCCRERERERFVIHGNLLSVGTQEQSSLLYLPLIRTGEISRNHGWMDTYL